MTSIVAIAVVALVGLLFAAMAVAPLWIETKQAKPRPTTSLVLVDTAPGSVSEPDHPQAA